MDLDSISLTTDNPDDYIGGAEMLFKQDRFDELEKYCSIVLERFPNQSYYWSLLGWVAEKQKNWTLSAARWNSVRIHAPTDFNAHVLWLQALRRSGQSREAAEAMSLIAQSFPDADLKFEQDKTEFHLRARDFMARCESMGNGCEFGGLQRDAGHEPLGLLRWASISPTDLANGIISKFDGIGEKENLILSVSGQEYYLIEKLYGIRMHTFISSDVDEGRVLDQLSRRLRFLARKFAEELELAEKIFVYKYAEASELPPLLQQESQAIFEALQKHGPNRMLLVEKVGYGQAAGDTICVNDRYVRGYVGTVVAYDGVNESDYSAWTKICHEAARIFG